MNAGLSLRLRIFAARTHQTVGWAGWVGLGLLLVASTWLGLAWRIHRAPLSAMDVPVLPMPSTESPPPSAPVSLRLPDRGEVPLVLTQIQQTVVAQGLGWTAADYKVTPATAAVPATLEVRCSLKGTYPKLRSVIAQLLRRVPGLAIRDFAISRPNIDVAEVDAKLTLAVFLHDEPSSAGGPTVQQKGSP